MSWSGYWIRRARSSAQRQTQIFGLKLPRALDSLLQEETLHLGLIDTLRVMAFVFFGPPRGKLVIEKVALVGKRPRSPSQLS